MTKAALSALFLLFAATTASADDKKIDPKKLVGKWESKVKGVGATVIEFAADGKMVILVTTKGKDIRIDGTYSVEGNKLTTRSGAGANRVEETRTVDRLTDAELVTTGDKGADTLVRVKGDKIDAKLLIGKWEPKGEENRNAVREVEYTKDGKKLTTLVVKGKVVNIEERCRTDGDKLVVLFESGGKDREQPFTIETLTDAELVIRNEGGVKFTYTRLKDKK